MIILKKALPRRTFLRGVGAAVALPLLDSMIPRSFSRIDSPFLARDGVSDAWPISTALRGNGRNRPSCCANALR